MTTRKSEAQGNIKNGRSTASGLQSPQACAPSLPTELLMLIVEWRVLQAGPRLHPDLCSLCLTSRLFKQLAEPHMYKVISVSTPSKVLLLEKQLRSHADRCKAVRAAWWSYSFARRDLICHPSDPYRDAIHSSSYEGDIRVHFPNIEHIAWWVPPTLAAAPMGFHYKIRDGEWFAGEHIPSIPVDVASETPRATTYSTTEEILLQRDREAASYDHLPRRGLWAAHFVVDAVRRWMPYLVSVVRTFRHITITLFHSSRSTDKHLEQSLRDILKNCPALQSLVIRDASGEQQRRQDGTALPAGPSICEIIAAKINDSRLHVEAVPSDFHWATEVDYDWAMEFDKVAETFTRQQWEEAVYQTGSCGPWRDS